MNDKTMIIKKMTTRRHPSKGISSTNGSSRTNRYGSSINYKSYDNEQHKATLHGNTFQQKTTQPSNKCHNSSVEVLLVGVVGNGTAGCTNTTHHHSHHQH